MGRMARLAMLEVVPSPPNKPTVPVSIAFLTTGLFPLTVTGGESARDGSLAGHVGIGRLGRQRRHRARGGLGLGLLLNGGHRGGCIALRREGVGAHTVERAGLGWRQSRCRRSSGKRGRFLAWEGGTKTQLQLRLGGTEERLVDLGVLGVQGDVSTGAVGVAFEDDGLVGWDL